MTVSGKYITIYGTSNHSDQPVSSWCSYFSPSLCPFVSNINQGSLQLHVICSPQIVAERVLSPDCDFRSMDGLGGGLKLGMCR
ncbi:hypothetical protein PILCRDRAFT_810353, partial [Piloderma croceum F 1598]